MMSEKQIRQLRDEIIAEYNYQWKKHLKEEFKSPNSEESKKRYNLHRDEGIKLHLIDQILNYK